MFEEIYKANYGDRYYLEFTCTVSTLFDDYQRFMDLVWGSNREILRIHLNEEATDPYDRSILPEYENTTPEEFKNLPGDAIIGADDIMIFFADHTVISYSLRKPLICVETPESDFTLDSYIFEHWKK